MLLSFSIDNYLSFRKKVTLDLKAGTIKEFASDNLYSTSSWDYKVLKCLAIYGINSSGKTNILKAFSFMRSFVLNSSKETQANEKIAIEPFALNIENDNKASFFEVEFLIKNRKFRYGFIATQDIILQEWLFYTERRKEEHLFIRNKNDFDISKKFRVDTKGKTDLLMTITRANALFISVLSQFNNELAIEITNWFQSNIIIFDANQEECINYTASLLSDEKYNIIHQILRISDLGFTNVEQEIKDMAKKMGESESFLSALHGDSAKRYSVKTKHKKYDSNDKPIDNVYFDLSKQESLGTQRYFGLLGPIVNALLEQKSIWIDELDARLHTNLLHNIVRMFNSNKENPNGAQLIFTSHNPTLMKRNLRRDQMIMVEKDNSEGTIVRSLYEKDPKVRNDASFDKDFLAGKYVKVPKIEIQLDLFGNAL
ncbi:MAG: ATP-binding protein [Chitinophagales bacterium]|nr:ATP-binding protein [Chitinophagales bacterium]